MNPFELLRTRAIPTLQATLEEYHDPASGARHVHLANDGAEMVFLVAFPTVPDNSDGRAHILEHLALAGSERYPVRDPFFSMMRRSTATFMNAMTYADRTVYPFASTSSADFFNLLDVYLDATFFPRLDYLNFLQEGWRHVLDGDTLGYQGVVFNEMKGAFADPGRALYHGVLSRLLQGTTYESVSGGDPLAIPDLTHAALKAFHAQHYHPSQAVFMTAGPLPATEIQQHIGTRVLARLSGRAPLIAPQLATPRGLQEAVISIPSQAGREDGHGVQFGWILGEAADSATYYRASLLETGLLGDAAAPLRKAMESAGYGRPSRINGMDSNPRQMLFHLGMEGLRHDQVGDARALIQAALEQAAQTGVSVDVLRATLRNIRYRQRDTSSGQTPNVLGRMLRVVPVALRGGDIQSAFDSESVLEQLERDIADPGFFKAMVRALLDAPARLTATVVPDADYFTKRDVAQAARLAAEQAGLSDDDRRRITADNAALLALQGTANDTGVLPRITPRDVPLQPRALPQLAAQPVHMHTMPIASNGISYARVQFDVSAIPEADWPWLQLYVDLRGGLGVAGRSYDDADAWRQQAAPVFGLGLAPALVDGALSLALSFYASGLHEEHAGIADVLNTHIGQPRFDEHVRIAFLCTQMAQQRNKSLAQMGDHYASLNAGSQISTLRYFENAVSGTPRLQFLDQLQQLAATEAGVAQIAQQLARLHAIVTAAPATLVCAGSGDHAAQLSAMIVLPTATQVTAPAAPRPAGAALRIAPALHAPSQVNHCFQAWAVPDERHPDAGALAVAAELLTHQFLHTSIREKGGAYGGVAGYLAGAGVFSLKSYRDPRLAGTFADFAAAIDGLMTAQFSVEQIEEAIITVIKGLDRPLSPLDEVLVALGQQRRGITMAHRAALRTAVLNCTMADVKAVVSRWLHGVAPQRAAFVGDSKQDLAGLELVDLAQLAGGARVDA
jgi:Zn-dependent M16 (insulinase) family peptidase